MTDERWLVPAPAGADLRRVHLLSSGTDPTQPFDLGVDLEALEKTIMNLGVQILTLDPQPHEWGVGFYDESTGDKEFIYRRPDEQSAIGEARTWKCRLYRRPVSPWELVYDFTELSDASDV